MAPILAGAILAVLASTARAAGAARPAAGATRAQPGGGDAGWTVGAVLEPESVEEVEAALVRGPGGLVLAIAREPGGAPGEAPAIGILRLAPADRDFLDESRAPTFQIDGGPRFEPRRHGGSLKSVTFLLWDGVGEPVFGPLRDLMEARERITVVYPLAGGGHKEATLPAAGIKTALARALGVSEQVAPAAAALAAARQAEVERCLAEEKPKDRDRCLERLAGCGDTTTAEDLQSCLASGRKKK